MNQKPCPSNSAISDQIRQEIQRFESVHPCIYAIYDFVDLIPDQLIAQQIRDHVVCIEDSFVNSQEWTLSRSVPDLKLGVLGSIASGKSALVHRYLTGSYMQEESPEGGRFKKEVVIDGQSYLLLIRDEGGLPEEQFTQWVDAVILVFSLESEVSFNAAYNYYAKMARFRNTAEIPIILVGSQDAICTNRPRVVEEARARRLANDLKRCPYYETCATYGLNVERVFREACQKIIVQRQQGTVMSLPPCNSCQRTPSHMSAKTSFNFPSQQFSQSGGPPSSSALPLQLSPLRRNVSTTGASNLSPSHCAAMQCSTPSTSSMKDYCATMSSQGSNNSVSSLGVNLARPSASHNLNNNSEKENHASDVDAQECGGIPTPSSTPTANRKTNRRISNIFKKDDDNKRNHSSAELGSGRAIPIKQGNLYKRSNKPLNKEWKKKFVALYDDGRLTYHSNIKDYMEENNGKELFLGHTTVKVPGQYRPRNSRCQTQPILSNGILTKDFTTSKLSFRKPGSSSDNQSVHLTAFETIPETKAQKFSNIHDFGVNGDEFSMSANLETPNLKKKKHFKKTSGKSDTQDADSCEFIIVSIDNRQWHFEAASQEERDEWVQAIEQQILCSLQGNETNKSKDGNIAQSDETAVLALREVEGNSACADCGMPGPDWVSINLGALICIECSGKHKYKHIVENFSGIHRNLGSHISKVRSLDLDSWPVPYISVLRQLGNNVVNRIWEYKVGTAHRIKPESTSSREVKEKWIRAKYERNEFLAPLPNGASVSQQLLDAILHKELTAVLLALAHGGPALLKHTVSSKDLRLPLHFACAVACPRIVQLLLWWNANPDVADHEGHTALYYARQSGSTDCIEILQYAGCTTSTVEPPRLRTNELSRDNSTTNSRLQQPLRHSSDVFDNLPDSVI